MQCSDWLAISGNFRFVMRIRIKNKTSDANVRVRFGNVRMRTANNELPDGLQEQMSSHPKSERSGNFKTKGFFTVTKVCVLKLAPTKSGFKDVFETSTSLCNFK